MTTTACDAPPGLPPRAPAIRPIPRCGKALGGLRSSDGHGACPVHVTRGRPLRTDGSPTALGFPDRSHGLACASPRRRRQPDHPQGGQRHPRAPRLRAGGRRATGSRASRCSSDGPKFDLVLLDFVMPRMNGYQFCRELRSQPRPPRAARRADERQGRQDPRPVRPADRRGRRDHQAVRRARAGRRDRGRARARRPRGRARPVPEGDTMPDEDTIAEHAAARPKPMLRARARQRGDDGAAGRGHAVPGDPRPARRASASNEAELG